MFVCQHSSGRAFAGLPSGRRRGFHLHVDPQRSDDRGCGVPRRRGLRARRAAHRLQGCRRAVPHDAGAGRPDPAAGRRLVSGSCEHDTGRRAALARSGARARRRPDPRRHRSRRRDAHPGRAVPLLSVSGPADRASDAARRDAGARRRTLPHGARDGLRRRRSSCLSRRRKPTRSTSSAPRAARCREKR